MLIDIRDRAGSWVAYIIIGLLVLSFSLWGVQEYFGGGGIAPVANVNGKEISLQEFSSQFQQYKQRLQSISGNNYQQQYPDEGAIKEQVIDDMVRIEILRQEATSAGFRTSDASLIHRIQQIPQFQKNGKFDSELYERLLQVQRYNKTQFENDLREQDKIRQFEISLIAFSFMPKVDLQRFQKLSEQSRDFKFALIKADSETVMVSFEEIDYYYNDNQQLFQTSEQVKLAYIELKEEELVDKITITAAAARAMYDAQLERYITDELRNTRHILLKVPSEVGSDAIEWDEALEKANDLVQQLNNGASFADLAKQHSEDSLSAEKGGKIGLIARDDFASTELQHALFSLNIGEYSKPIRTEQGIQVVKLDEIQASKQKPFEDVREQISNDRKSQLAQQQFIEIADELANLMVEQPDDLEEASEIFGLEIKETGWLAPASNTNIFAFPKIQLLAFSEDILEEGLNSEPVEVTDGHVIAFRLIEHKKSEQKPLESVSEDIKKVITIRKASEQAITKGQEIFTQMQAGSSLEHLSIINSLELISYGALRRDDNRVPSTITKRAFNLSRPTDDTPSVGGIAQLDGSFALVELHKVIDGSEQLDDAKVMYLSQRVNYGRREFNAALESIKESTDVQVFENNL
jgi:peptidyl-prolyl cis-trans isomerase D